jgi:hypothetical protein
MSILKVFILFSFIFSSLVWGQVDNNKVVQPVVTTAVKDVTIPEAPYVFDYANDKQNDCWDVNTNDGKWLSFTRIENTEYPETIKDNKHKKLLCQGLVYYRNLTSEKAKNQAVKITSCNITDGVDPVCEYYRKLYEDKKDELASALLRYGIMSQSDLSGYKKDGDFPINDKFRTIKACQWVSTSEFEGYCAPRPNVSIASSYKLPETPQNILSKKLCREEGVTDCFGQYVNEDAFIKNQDDGIKILQLFRYLLEKQDRYLLSRFTLLSSAGALLNIDQKKLYEKIIEVKKENYNSKSSFSLDFKESDLSNAIKKDAKNKDIESFVLELKPIACDKFDKTDPLIINLISNANRKASITLGDDCRIFVVKVNKIEEKDGTYSIKDSKSIFKNTEFIYNDDYMVFLPVSERQNIYSVNNDSQGDSPLTSRYNTVCDDMVGMTENVPKKGLVYLKDMQNILVAQALIGGNSGAPQFKYSQKNKPVFEDKNLQILSKGDLTFTIENTKYNVPKSTQKLSALAFYCEKKTQFFTPLRLDQKVTDFEKKFSNAFERAAEYYDNVRSKGLREKKEGEEPYKPVLGIINQNNELLSDRDIESSMLYSVFVKRNSSQKPTLPKAYQDELDFVATYRPDRPRPFTASFGTTKFYYALAEKAGYVINGDVQEEADWEFVGNDLASGDDYKQNSKEDIYDYNNNPSDGELVNSSGSAFNYHRYFSPIYNLLIPSAYSDGGIGAPIASAENVYYFMQANSGNMLGTVQSTTSSYQFWLRAYLDAFDNINGVSSNNNNVVGSGKGGRFGNFLSSITGETLTKAGMLALTYLMTSQQLKMDRDRIKSQMQLEAVKARMNQCSSLDCTVKEDVCKMQTVEKDKKFLGIKTGTKYVAIDPGECNFCATEVPQEYRDPYTGETKMMSLYEICLANVVGGMLNRNPCYDLIATSNKYPGMISDADIRRCFLGLPAPTKQDLSFPYVGAPAKTPDAKTAEEKKKDDKKAATSAAPGGGGGTGSPGGPGAKNDEPFNKQSYGRYGDRGGRAPSGPSGDYYYRRDGAGGTYGGAETAAQGTSGTGLVVGTPSDELGIERMTKEVNRATGQALTVPPAK